jgi:hypothetical protein
MNNQSINGLEGSRVSKKVFHGFTVEDTLIEYDHPLLLVARSPKPKDEKWLFKWCDYADPSGDVWIALSISEERLKDLKSNRISLREAVSLPENKFYVFEAKSKFEPTKIIESVPEKLPKDYLPSDDISVSGVLLRQEVQDREGLTVRFHVFSDHFAEGMAPLSLIGPLQRGFQEYMTWTGHALERTPKGRVPPAIKDWSGFNLTSMSKGSFRMECVSKSKRKKTKILMAACEILADLSNGKLDRKSIEEKFSEEFGKEIINYTSLLAKFISNFDLSMSINWASTNNPNGFLALDKRRAENILTNLAISKDRFLRKITITLTPTEAEPIRRPVEGRGGYAEPFA